MDAPGSAQRHGTRRTAPRPSEKCPAAANEGGSHRPPRGIPLGCLLHVRIVQSAPFQTSATAQTAARSARRARFAKPLRAGLIPISMNGNCKVTCALQGAGSPCSRHAFTIAVIGQNRTFRAPHSTSKGRVCIPIHAFLRISALLDSQPGTESRERQVAVAPSLYTVGAGAGVDAVSGPSADKNRSFGRPSEVCPQLQGACFEIVWWDSPATLLSGVPQEQAGRLLRT